MSIPGVSPQPCRAKSDAWLNLVYSSRGLEVSMAKLILHIGIEKTGASSIQGFLVKNRSILQDKMYIYLLF
jgi:hypothetical protein